MNRVNVAMYDAVIKNIPNTGRILDIGFGNGVTLERAMKSSGAIFYGIDKSGDMVKAASKRNKKAIREGRLILSEGSADSVPFTQEFDCIYTINTVYFWEDLNAGLREIRGKLAGGGVFINVLYTKERLDKLTHADVFRKYTPDELVKAAEDNGFTASVEVIEEGRSYMVKAFK